jgi:transcriptional regulator with XRE-family HTH domain
MDYELFVAERIARLRDQKGVSARDMSLSLGQSEGYINILENKRNLPSMSLFFYICEYLGVTPQEFFDQEISHPTQISNFINIIKQLKEDEVADLMNIALKLRNKR